jgi:hypothetical protein
MAQVNAENLARMSSEMANLQQRIPKSAKLKLPPSPEDIDQIMIVNSPSVLQQKQPLTPGNSGIDNGIDLTKSDVTFQPDTYTFFSYSLPKNTLYLLIVLFIVGIALWYITSNTKKKKENTIIDEDENRTSIKKDKIKNDNE